MRIPRSGRALGRRLPVTLLLAALLAPGVLVAQSDQRRNAELRVLVRDPQGAPVAAAQVTARPLDAAPALTGGTSPERVGSTDSVGHVVLLLPPGATSVAIRRLGFAPHTATAQLREGTPTAITVNLVPAPQELMQMEVKDRRDADVVFMEGFHERRKRGFGNFITRQQIVERRPVVMSDMLRTVPGLRMVWVNGQPVPRFNRTTGRNNVDCPPQFWIDNSRVDNLNLDHFLPADIEGMEFYGLSSTPPQFMSRAGSSNCGTIIVWTRRP